MELPINENIYQERIYSLTYVIIRDKIHIPRKGMDVKGVCLWKTRIQIIWKTNQKKDAVATRPSIVRKKEYKDLMNRLSRIEGQVRGIKGMLEKDAYCPEILVQVSAVNAALNSFNKVLLANHIRTCVADDIREGKDETVDELVKVLQKLMR